MHIHRRSFRNRGFSLVEVTLALGVASFVMITMAGLIPMGLATFKQAMGTTVESQIAQQITNDLLLDNFSTISGYATSPTTIPVYYYDAEGTPMATSTGWVFKATFTLTAVGNSNSPVTFSNSTGNPAYNVLITITNASDNTSYTQQHLHQYSMILANNGL